MYSIEIISIMLCCCYNTAMQLQIGVKVLLKNDQDKYLFLQKTELLQNEHERSWDIPGGRINPDEHLPDALTREVLEEIGIRIHAIPTLINAQDIFVPAKNLHVVRLTYVVHEEPESAIVLSDEHQAYKWATIAEISTNNVDPYLLETLTLL